MRHRVFPFTAGAMHGLPERVLAPQRGLASIGPALRGSSPFIFVAETGQELALVPGCPMISVADSLASVRAGILLFADFSSAFWVSVRAVTFCSRPVLIVLKCRHLGRKSSCKLSGHGHSGFLIRLLGSPTCRIYFIVAQCIRAVWARCIASK